MSASILNHLGMHGVLDSKIEKLNRPVNTEKQYSWNILDTQSIDKHLQNDWKLFVQNCSYIDDDSKNAHELLFVVDFFLELRHAISSLEKKIERLEDHPPTRLNALTSSEKYRILSQITDFSRPSEFVAQMSVEKRGVECWRANILNADSILREGVSLTMLLNDSLILGGVAPLEEKMDYLAWRIELQSCYSLLGAALVCLSTVRNWFSIVLNE